MRAISATDLSLDSLTYLDVYSYRMLSAAPCFLDLAKIKEKRENYIVIYIKLDPKMEMNIIWNIMGSIYSALQMNNHARATDDITDYMTKCLMIWWIMFIV